MVIMLKNCVRGNFDAEKIVTSGCIIYSDRH